MFSEADADGVTTDVRLSKLFAPAGDSLVIYNFMFPRDYRDDRPGPASGRTALLPLAECPCPSCVALLDQLDGAAWHATQRVNFAVVAKTPLSRLHTFAEERGCGRGAHLRAGRSRTGPPQRRHARTALEHLRPHPRGSPHGLGRAVAVRVKEVDDHAAREGWVVGIVSP